MVRPGYVLTLGSNSDVVGSKYIADEGRLGGDLSILSRMLSSNTVCIDESIDSLVVENDDRGGTCVRYLLESLSSGVGSSFVSKAVTKSGSNLGFLGVMLSSFRCSFAVKGLPDASIMPVEMR